MYHTLLFSQGKFPIGIHPTDIPEGTEKYAHINPEEKIEEPESPYGFPGDGMDIPPGATESMILNGLAKKYEGAGFKPGPAPDLSKMPQIEPAEESAKAMEKLVHDQLDESHAMTVLRHVLFEMCLLGTGILKGPFT